MTEPKWTIEQFIDNIEARGPDSGKGFHEIIGEFVDTVELMDWLSSIGCSAVDIASQQASVDRTLERLQRMDDSVDPDDPEDRRAAAMTAAMEHLGLAALAAGFFLGQAAGPGDGIKTKKKTGWEI